MSVLTVENLEVRFEGAEFRVRPLSFSVEEGEIVTIVGESGCGKTTVMRAITALNQDNARVSGVVKICGKNLYELKAEQLREMRMRDFSIAFQNSGELLNPRMTVGAQLDEILKKKYSGKEKEEIRKSLLQQVGLEESILSKRPRELSGGMLQRYLIISAVALGPRLVLLDEPTSALDLESRDRVLEMIRKIQKTMGMAFLVITHDFYVAKALSTRMLVMYQGKLVEMGRTEEMIRRPQHPYTRGLLRSSMDIYKFRDIWGIYQHTDNWEWNPGCPFYARCHQHLPECENRDPCLQPSSREPDRLIACNRGGIVTVLEGKELCKCYGSHQVIDRLNIHLDSAEVLSLVGVSGAGKSTLANLLAGYLPCDSGEILFDDQPLDLKNCHRRKHGLQMIFQDPDDVLNPRMTVEQAVAEPSVLNEPELSREALHKKVEQALADVGLPVQEKFLAEPVGHLSGGQKQRVTVARALMLEPKVLVADEPTSMLDASCKANLIRMLKGVQNKHGLSILFVTHDLSCAEKISDRILRLKDNGELEPLETELQ